MGQNFTVTFQDHGTVRVPFLWLRPRLKPVDGYSRGLICRSSLPDDIVPVELKKVSQNPNIFSNPLNTPNPSNGGMGIMLNSNRNPLIFLVNVQNA